MARGWRWGRVGAVLVLAVLGAIEARAGGFTQPAGGIYLKVWDRTLVGSRAYLADGSAASVGETYQDHALNVYLEYGIADDWTLVATGRPLGWAAFGDESAVYVGDLRLGMRRALLSGAVALAAEARYGYAPDVGTRALAVGEADGQPFVYAAAVETHGLDAELQLGTAFSWGWLSSAAGFRWLSAEGLDPVVYANLGVGYLFDFGLAFDVYVALHQPLGAVETTNVSGVGQTRYLGYGLDVSYWVSPSWSVNAGVGGVFFAESNAATPALALGFAYRR